MVRVRAKIEGGGEGVVGVCYRYPDLSCDGGQNVCFLLHYYYYLNYFELI